MKCDESKPQCKRCTESGRKCEGRCLPSLRHEIPARATASTSVSKDAVDNIQGPVAHQIRFIHDQVEATSQPATPKPELVLVSPHNQDERRAFHFFTHRAAPILAGAIDAGFWLELIPRLSQTYSFVWDTVVCISSLIEHVPYTSLALDSPLQVVNQEHQKALRLYNRAIANVKALFMRDNLDDSIIALSYVLFSATEYFQKNVQTGNRLLQRCSKILIGSLATHATGRHPTGDPAMQQVITPFVMRRALDIASFDEAIRPQWAVNDNRSTALRNLPPPLNESRIQFHELANQCFEVVRVADIVRNIQSDDDRNKTQLLSQRRSLLDKLVQWRTCLIATTGQEARESSGWVRAYLLMYWAFCYISLATCVSHRQVIFDGYMIYFAEIVQHATSCLEIKTTKIETFSDRNSEVIPALYFCAVKCRDPVLRREALRLIRQTELGDLWGIVAPDRVAAKFISVEESGGKDFSNSRCTDLPPEEHRFACANVFGARAPDGRQRKALELSRYEYAGDGSRRLITRYTWLDEELDGAVMHAFV